LSNSHYTALYRVYDWNDPAERREDHSSMGGGNAIDDLKIVAKLQKERGMVSSRPEQSNVWDMIAPRR
jgi:hypothetical protein